MALPSKTIRPAVGAIAPETRLNSVVLPGAVGADQTGNRAGHHLQGTVVHRPDSAEVLDHVAYLKDGVVFVEVGSVSAYASAFGRGVCSATSVKALL